MKSLSFSLFCLVFVLLMVPFCYSDDDEERKPSFEGAMKGFGSWFKDSAENVKEKSEEGLDTLKGWAGSVADRFSNAKDKVEEAGEKSKEAVKNAAHKVSEEVGSAASKVSEHAGKAMDSMKSLVN